MRISRTYLLLAVSCPEIFRLGAVRNNQNACTGTKGALNGRPFRDHTRIIQETESEDRSESDDTNGMPGVSVVTQWDRSLN